MEGWYGRNAEIAHFVAERPEGPFTYVGKVMTTDMFPDPKTMSAPHNPRLEYVDGKYILLYKIYEAQDISLEERIAVLKEYKKREYNEKWAYELAFLYHRVGLATECVEECDQLILWFGEGKYVLKAMELKRLYVPLSPAQQQLYDSQYGGRNAVEEAVKKQIDYDCLMSFKDDAVVKMVEEIKDLMVDVLCGERTVISEGKRVSEETAKAAYRKITFEHVQYVLHSLLNYPDKISRIDRFLTVSCSTRFTR